MTIKKQMWMAKAGAVLLLSLTGCGTQRENPEDWNFLIGVCEITGQNSIYTCDEDQIMQQKEEGGLIFYHSDKITIKVFARHLQTGEFMKISESYPAIYSQSGDRTKISMQVNANGCISENMFQINGQLITKIKGKMFGECNLMNEKSFQSRPDSMQIKYRKI
jgi:hypothetical protein